MDAWICESVIQWKYKMKKENNNCTSNGAVFLYFSSKPSARNDLSFQFLLYVSNDVCVCLWRAIAKANEQTIDTNGFSWWIMLFPSIIQCRTSFRLPSKMIDGNSFWRATLAHSLFHSPVRARTHVPVSACMPFGINQIPFSANIRNVRWFDIFVSLYLAETRIGTPPHAPKHVMWLPLVFWIQQFYLILSKRASEKKTSIFTPLVCRWSDAKQCESSDILGYASVHSDIRHYNFTFMSLLRVSNRNKITIEKRK